MMRLMELNKSRLNKTGTYTTKEATYWNPYKLWLLYTRGADNSLARPGRKQATATKL